jgi:hypothetical protein
MILALFDQKAGEKNGKYSFLDNYCEDMQRFSKDGIMAFNESDKTNWLVFPVLHKILGDGPGRTALTGYKSSSGEAFKLCHGCEIGARDLKDQFNDQLAYKEYPRRDATKDSNAATQIVHNREIGNVQMADLLSKVSGITTKQIFWDIPGCEKRLPEMISYDFFHLGPEGTMSRHWGLFSTELPKSIPNFWFNINNRFKDYVKQNHLNVSAKMESYNPLEIGSFRSC